MADEQNPHVVRQQMKDYEQAYMEEFTADSSKEKILKQFRGNANTVAEELVRLALFSKTDSIRMRTGMFIVDKLTETESQSDDALAAALRKMTAPEETTSEPQSTSKLPTEITFKKSVTESPITDDSGDLSEHQVTHEMPIINSETPLFTPVGRKRK